jgi:hypothetical protein
VGAHADSFFTHIFHRTSIFENQKTKTPPKSSKPLDLAMKV